MDRREYSSRSILPMGSCLTLALVLVASLTPQPVGAGPLQQTDRSTQSAVQRSSGGGDFALGYALLIDSGGCATVAPLARLDLELRGALATEDPGTPLPANPRCSAQRPRGP
jgi:hypothetical protein